MRGVLRETSTRERSWIEYRQLWISSRIRIEPPLTSRDAQCDPRLQTELNEANYIGEIRPLEVLVVRNVEEDRVFCNTWNRH
jgi:hypothetical protein